MATKITLSRVGNSVGAILPKDALGKLGVEAGDALFLTESPDGGYRLTPYDPEFERQIAAAEGVMKRRRTVLRELAK